MPYSLREFYLVRKKEGQHTDPWKSAEGIPTGGLCLHGISPKV